MSHSRLRPHLCASASEDGTARLWAGPALGGGAPPAAVLAPPTRGAPLTCAHFSPHDEHALAVAASDHRLYVYDLRRPAAPLWALAGHARPASYVRFLGRGHLVSAAVDSTLAAWGLPGLQQEQQPPQEWGQLRAQQQAPVVAAWEGGSAGGSGSGTGACGVLAPSHVFRGHDNAKNFVGLAVREEGGLLACGSEGPGAFAYQLSWEAPLARGALEPAGGGSAPATGSNLNCEAPAGAVAPVAAAAPAAPFCSAVCWQPAAAAGPGGTPLLAAAMSDGELRVLGLQALR